MGKIQYPASGLAALFLKDHIKKGGVTIVPSLGIVITSRHLGDDDQKNAVSPSKEKVEEAIKDCIASQEIMLARATDGRERAEIHQRLASLHRDLADPSKYFLEK